MLAMRFKCANVSALTLETAKPSDAKQVCESASFCNLRSHFVDDAAQLCALGGDVDGGG
jgi:hypothetical protein